MARFHLASKLAALGAVAALLIAGATEIGSSAEPAERVIKITARKFEYTPNEVILKKGEPVVLEFATQDVLMGFNAPELGVRTDIVPGRVSRVRVVPQKVGTFTYLCDIFCGIGHEDMNGKIIVVE